MYHITNKESLSIRACLEKAEKVGQYISGVTEIKINKRYIAHGCYYIQGVLI